MSRRSASPAEDAIHDLLQTMSQKERDARYDAKHKQLCVSVSRALENAAWTLDEFCNNDADRQTVWTEISDGAQRMLAQLVAAGRPRASNATEPSGASSALAFAPPSPSNRDSGGTAPVPSDDGAAPTTQADAPRPSTAVWKSNFRRPTPSTRCCPRGRVGSMTWRFTKVSAIILWMT